MKVRHGFVSNSSSSSFIVVFPRKPQTNDELKEMMGELPESPYGTVITPNPDQVVADVLEDIQKQGTSLTHRMLRKRAKETYRDVDEEMEALEEFQDRYPDAFIFFTEYCDEGGGFSCYMEHAGIFDKLPSKQFSHH